MDLGAAVFLCACVCVFDLCVCLLGAPSRFTFSCASVSLTLLDDLDNILTLRCLLV